MDSKLHEAVRYGDKEGVLEALRQGFDPNVLGLLRWSPVQEAARAGERQILFILLKHGGDPNLHDGLCSQNTALHFAAEEGHLDCLRLLLKHGGDASLLNAERKTCVHVTPLEYKDEVLKLIQECGGKGGRPEDSSNQSNVIDQPITPRANSWSSPPRAPKRAEMGYLHLSFEYHKETLKVRVWQISDLLLPPPQISMIHSIFVRTYFIPDKARKSQRRTEEIIIDTPQFSGMETPKTGIQHIFTPSSFKFRTPLQYRAVTEAVVSEHSLQLEVCMTQKRSHRTFLIAMVHLPLRTAVRKPIREKYPLIPCMNITIPNNMRVYSASQLELESSKGSNSPSIRRVTEPVSEVPVTAREVELEDVVSLSGEDFLRSHLSLCLGEDSDSEGAEKRDNNQLSEVLVSNGVGSGGSSNTTLNIPSSGEDEDEQDDNEDISVIVAGKRDFNARSTPVDMSCVENSKRKIIPNEMLKAAQDVAVEMPSEDTVVNMDVLASADTPHRHSAVAPAPSGKTQARRKIIPAGLEKDFVINNECVSEISAKPNVSQGDRIQGHTSPDQKVTGSPVVSASRRKKVMVLPGDSGTPSRQRTSASMSRPSKHSSSDVDGMVPESRIAPQFPPLQDSAFSPASRPETPCWDFYDWVEDWQAEEGLEVTSRTLEDSLAQLREQGIGSLQNLTKEPILPMDLADDFDSLTIDNEQAEGNRQSAENEHGANSVQAEKL